MRHAIHIGYVLCTFIVLTAILVAGLWPFHAPRNHVSWLNATNALQLGPYGLVLGQGNVLAGSAFNDGASLEVWLKPSAVDNEAPILTIYRADNPVHFALRQYNENLIVERPGLDAHHGSNGSRDIVPGVFRKAKPVFVTVTCDQRGLTVFVDGIVAGVLPGFGPSNADLMAGQLLLGNAPNANESWEGQLRGLGIYARALSPSEVLKHFEVWKSRKEYTLADDTCAMALYTFARSEGRVVPNLVRSGSDLYIPDQYLVLKPPLLAPPWEEYHSSRSYWKHVAINIGGFVPLGIVVYGYLSGVVKLHRSALSTVLTGAAISLVIEIVQAYLPTRSSGTTDIITNTLGTGLGVTLGRYAGSHRICKQW